MGLFSLCSWFSVPDGGCSFFCQNNYGITTSTWAWNDVQWWFYIISLLIWGGALGREFMLTFFSLANQVMSFFSSRFLSWIFFPTQVAVEFFSRFCLSPPPQIINGSSLKFIKVWVENFVSTFLFSLMLVKMAWTLQVLLNIAPNESVKPIDRTQLLAFIMIKTMI